MAAFLAAIPAIISAVGALKGMQSKKSGATDTIRGVDTPGLEAYQSPTLEEYQQVGLMRPEEAQTILQGQSAYETVSGDPRLRGSQMDALAQLQQIVDAGGMDAMARADLEDVLGRQRTESRGAQEAIMQNARARGLYGSDLELVNRMVAQQAAAQAGSRQALDVAALAQQRKMAALQDAAGLAGNIRNTDFNEAARRAEAADAISRFNAANRQDVERFNVGNRNDAQQLNLGAKQAISSANVDLRNQQRQQNQSAPVARYKDVLGQAGMLAEAQLGGAKTGVDQQQNQQAAFGSLTNSLTDLFKKKGTE